MSIHDSPDGLRRTARKMRDIFRCPNAHRVFKSRRDT
jgi:hypothetical protein